MRIYLNNRNANKAGNVKSITFVPDSPTNMEGAKLLESNYPCSLIDIQFIARHYLVKCTTHKSTLGGASP